MIWSYKQWQKYGPQVLDPFSPEKVRKVEIDGTLTPVLSYGTEVYGYTLSLGNSFEVMPYVSEDRKVLHYADGVSWSHQQAVPMALDFGEDARYMQSYHVHNHKDLYVPRNSYVLGVSREYIKMPKNVVGICLGKSTYARMGLSVNITPLEPGWKGWLTIEIMNNSCFDRPARAGEGIAQLLFFGGDAEDEYNGNYQDQGCTPALAKV